MSLTWNLAVNCWIVLTFSCWVSIPWACAASSSRALLLQGLELCGNALIFLHSLFCPFSFGFLSHKCFHINSSWVPIRRKPIHSLREVPRCGWKRFFPKSCPIGRAGSVWHVAGWWAEWEKVLHQLVWADLSKGHAENANNNYKHWKEPLDV